jgi:hypothetical protein
MNSPTAFQKLVLKNRLGPPMREMFTNRSIQFDFKIRVVVLGNNHIPSLLYLNCFIEEIFKFIESALLATITAVWITGFERKGNIRHVAGTGAASFFNQNTHRIAGQLVADKRFVDQTPEIALTRL